MIINLEQHSITSLNYAVIYYQTLEEVPRPLSLEKSKKRQKFIKNFKKWQVL